MGAISIREKRLVVATALVLCYAVLGFTARGRLDAWKARAKEAEDTREELARRTALINMAEDWERRYEDNRGLMHRFADGVKVDTHWLKILDDAQRASGFNMNRVLPPVERVAVGDVREMTIECTEWKGTLGQLVRFLHELHSVGVMLDVRKLFIRPEARTPGGLNGSITLFCAYMRENQNQGSP